MYALLPALTFTFASVALAAPAADNDASALAVRSSLQIQGSPPMLASESSDAEESDLASGVTYTSNWAGYSHEHLPAGNVFESITGTFTVPNISDPAGQTAQYGLSTWVGLDTATSSPGVLVQAGVFQATHPKVYQAFYEWSPDASTSLELDVTAGQSVQVTLTRLSGTKAKVEMHNLDSGKSVTTTAAAPASTATLTGHTAQWIVEDYDYNNGLIPFADFDKVSWSGCEAMAGGKSYGVDDSEFEIKHNKKVLTKAVRSSKREFSIQRMNAGTP